MRLTASSMAVIAGLMVGPAPVRSQVLPPSGYQFQYAWYQGSAPVSGSLTVATGATFTLDVYLVQTATPVGGSPTFISDQGGLSSSAVRATYGLAAAGPPGVPAGTPGVIVATGATINASFNDQTSSNATYQSNADYAQFNATTDFTRGVAPDTEGRLLLGTLTFRATNTPDTSTTLTASVINQNNFDSLTYSMGNFSYVLDPNINPASVAVYVTPTPEPGGVMAVGAVVSILVWVRRQRSRAL